MTLSGTSLCLVGDLVYFPVNFCSKQGCQLQLSCCCVTDGGAVCGGLCTYVSFTVALPRRQMGLVYFRTAEIVAMMSDLEKANQVRSPPPLHIHAYGPQGH